MFRHIVAVGQKLQIMPARQTADELIVCVRLFPAQLVIEMNDEKNNAQLTAQLQQQPQKRDRVNPARNGNADTIPGIQQLFLPNVRQQAQYEGMHENMVQQCSCGDSRPRLSGRAKLDWPLISANNLAGIAKLASRPKDSRGRLSPHEHGTSPSRGKDSSP
jgi:hypothetical protein